MITLRRLDLVRKDSAATADELSALQTQLNAKFNNLDVAVKDLRITRSDTPLMTVGPAGSAEAPPVTPSGYIEIVVGGTAYVLPIYAKG